MLAAALVAVVAVAAAGAIGCSSDAGGAAGDGTGLDADGDTDNPTIRPVLDDDVDSILVLGDSLTNGARLFGDLGDRLDAAGFDSLEIRAGDGEDTSWALEEISPMDQVPEVVIVELGTNPDADTDGFAEAAANLVAMLRARGAERIAWLTPVHGDDDRYDAKSAILAQTPGIDHVADWASVVRGNPRRLAVDGLHPTEDGYVDLAEFLVETAASLASRAS